MYLEVNVPVFLNRQLLSSVVRTYCSEGTFCILSCVCFGKNENPVLNLVFVLAE